MRSDCLYWEHIWDFVNKTQPQSVLRADCHSCTNFGVALLVALVLVDNLLQHNVLPTLLIWCHLSAVGKL